MKKTLAELVRGLENELVRLGYSKGSLTFYKRKWRMLQQFAKEKNEIHFTESLGISFLEKYYQILEKDSGKKLSQKDVQELRVIRMLGDFQLHHTVLTSIPDEIITMTK